MAYLHQTLLVLHIAIGAFALFLFWGPIFVTKGGLWHRRMGAWFQTGMHVVAISGIVMCLLVFIDPVAVRKASEFASAEDRAAFLKFQYDIAWFLLMLSILVLLGVRQGMLALRDKANRKRLRGSGHSLLIAALLVTSGFTLVRGVTSDMLVLQIFAVLGVINSASALRYIWKPELKAGEWVVEHFSNFAGTGIGVYTAFFAFGGRAFFSEFFQGAWFVVPWIIPGVVGTALIVYFRPYYVARYCSEKSYVN